MDLCLFVGVLMVTASALQPLVWVLRRWIRTFKVDPTDFDRAYLDGIPIQRDSDSVWTWRYVETGELLSELDTEATNKKVTDHLFNGRCGGVSIAKIGGHLSCPKEK